jgi:hypothetical protein
MQNLILNPIRRKMIMNYEDLETFNGANQQLIKHHKTKKKTTDSLTRPRRLDRLWGPTQPSIKWVPGDLSPGAKRQKREADHSPPPNVELYLHSPIRLHGVVLN